MTYIAYHTKWNCKYHVVFAPKYRRKIFFREKRLEIGAILRELCNWRGVNIIEAEVCPGHIQRVLRGHSRKRCKENKGIYPKSVERRSVQGLASGWISYF